jgi:hypothetical protein
MEVIGNISHYRLLVFIIPDGSPYPNYSPKNTNDKVLFF